MARMKVPRSRIPKFKAVCMKCAEPCKIISSLQYADGMMRQIKCFVCDINFYTLQNWETEEVEVSRSVFKDRELSEYEEENILKMWNEDRTQTLVTFEVSVASRMVSAVRTKPEDRTPIDKMLVQAHDKIVARLKEMEDAEAIARGASGKSDAHGDALPQR